MSNENSAEALHLPPDLARWLNQSFAHYLGAGVQPNDPVRLRQFAEVLTQHQFSKAHALSFANNLSEIFYRLAGTVVVLGQEINQDIVGVAIGITALEGTKMLTLIPIFEDQRILLIDYGMLVGPLGEPGTGDPSLRCARPVLPENRVVTTKATLLPQSTIDAVEHHLTVMKYRTLFASAKYVVEYHPLDQTNRQRLMYDIVLDRNVFMVFELVSYNTDETEIVRRTGD